MTIPKSAQFKRAFFLALLAATHPPSHRIEQDEWNARVLPHTAIESLADNLWHVTGVLDKRLPPREMVLYRLPDTTLLIHSAIALNPAAMDRLESLGRPKILIVPNRIHRLDAALYKQRYPTLQVICPAAAQSFVEAVVPVDGIAEEILPRYGIVCHSPAGIYEQELAYELPLPSGRALVFTDILFNLTDAYLDKHIPQRGSVFSWLGASGYFGLTRFGRWFFLRDRTAYRQWLENLAKSLPDLEVISVAHGEPIANNCSQRLYAAARRLL